MGRGMMRARDGALSCSPNGPPHTQSGPCHLALRGGRNAFQRAPRGTCTRGTFGHAPVRWHHPITRSCAILQSNGTQAFSVRGTGLSVDVPEPQHTRWTGTTNANRTALAQGGLCTEGPVGREPKHGIVL